MAATSVGFGAFGAHGLKLKVSPQDLVIFEVGVRYQMYHSISIIVLGLSGYFLPHNIIQTVTILMLSGTFIFSGSLYMLILTNYRWLGAITPFGGMLLILGWLLFAYNIYHFSS